MILGLLQSLAISIKLDSLTVDRANIVTDGTAPPTITAVLSVPVFCQSINNNNSKHSANKPISFCTFSR